MWHFIQGKRTETQPSLKDAQEETEFVIFDAVGNLLAKTNTDPSEVLLFFSKS
jgi:hypothetical protein